MLRGLAVAAATLAAAGGAVHLTAKADGTTVHVRVGQTVVVTLPANASTGYAWSFSARGAPVLKLLSARYVAPRTTRVGAAGTFVARLSVVRRGTAALTLRYARHTRPATPAAQRFSVRVAAA